MNLIVVFLFSLLLFNGYLAANIGRESSRGDGQQQNKSENAVQVDEDFIYPMFEHSDFQEIVKFSKNPRFSEFVKDIIFPIKFGDYSFYLQIQDNAEVMVFPPMLLPGADAILMPGSVWMHSLDSYLHVIRSFGKSIRRLGIAGVNSLSEDDSTVLYHTMSEHCWNSVTDFEFGYIKNYTFTQFTRPYPKMETIYIYITTNEVGSDLPFDELFPNLLHLQFTIHDAVHDTEDDIPVNGSRFIEVEIPHMEHLEYLGISATIQNNRSDLVIILKQFENMFKKNPQIRRLSYHRDLDDFSQVIAKQLPNLEHLSISEIDPEMQPVHFDNVKQLMVAGWGGQSPYDRLTFSQLDSLEIHYYPGHDSGIARSTWMAFFRNHQNLRQLNCTASQSEGIEEFLAELQTLQELRMDSFESFNLDLVGRLIESHNNLLKFQYQANPPAEIDIAAFREKFENAWNITYITVGRLTLILEKKN